MQPRVKLTLVVVQVMFASMAIVGKLVFPVLPPEGLVVLRAAGATTVLATAVLWFGVGRIKSPRDWMMLGLLGLLGVAGNQTLFLVGLEKTTAINASILVTTIPVLTVFYSLIGRQERFSLGKLAGIVLAGSGAVYLIGPDRMSLAPKLVLGNSLIVLATMGYAAFLVLSKPILKRYDTLTVSLYVMAFGLLGTLPIGVPTLTRLDWGLIDGMTWFWVGFIILVPTVGAYFLNAWVLRRTSSQLVAAFIYLQPLVTVAIAPAVLEGERITGRTLAAGAAIFAGLAVVIWAEIRSEARPDSGS